MQFIDKMEYYSSTFLRHTLDGVGHETFMQLRVKHQYLKSVLSWELEK